MATKNRHFRRTAQRESAAGWLSSVLFHGAWLLALGLALEVPRQGAMQRPELDAGLLLMPTEEDQDNSSESEFAEAEEEIEIDSLIAEPADEPVEELSSETSPVVTPQSPLPLATPLAVAVEKGTELANPAELPGGSIFDVVRPEVGKKIDAGGNWPRVQGGRARVSVFGVTGEGTKFVYLFDRSVSMYGAPLGEAKRQLVQSLDSLEEIHQFQILFFNHRLTIFDHTEGQQRIAFATDVNKDLAVQFMSAITADGGTDRIVALGQAIRLRPDVIFFLTDADDPMPASELADIAKRNRRVGAVINTIEFGRGAEHGRYNFLVRLAEQSGGQYGYVDTRSFD